MTTSTITFIFWLTALAVSITFHEFLHAWTANYLGDPTPKAAGRVSLNPVAHIDPIGTIVLPIIMALTTGFVFGYRPGSDAEQRYRHWYQVQYHRPQDDLTQPMDWAAAGKFNRFFYGLVAAVANGDAPPRWKPGSPLAPAAAKERNRPDGR